MSSAAPRKRIRKLVTLPPDLAERFDQFREKSGATSEAEALKLLVEAGLKLHDTPGDLFRRCETATASGQSIGEIVNLVASNHPLVANAVVDNEAFIIALKTEGDGSPQRFCFSRASRKWKWETQNEQGFWEDDVPF